jgi:hypothetical protein
VVRRDGSVEGSGSGPRSGSPSSNLESNTDELIDDWDWKDDVDTLDGILRSDEGIKENNKLEGSRDGGMDRGDRRRCLRYGAEAIKRRKEGSTRSQKRRLKRSVWSFMKHERPE